MYSCQTLLVNIVTACQLGKSNVLGLYTYSTLYILFSVCEKSIGGGGVKVHKVCTGVGKETTSSPVNS